MVHTHTQQWNDEGINIYTENQNIFSLNLRSKWNNRTTHKERRCQFLSRKCVSILAIFVSMYLTKL